MSLRKTLWIPILQKKLLPLNDFLKESVDETAFIEGEQVVRSIEGEQPEVLLDSRGVVSATNLEDTPNAYAVHNLRTRTTLIEDVEEIELAYDKRASLIERHASQLNLKGVNFMAYKWSATRSSNIIRTTGTDVEATLEGAVGTRKMITLDEFSKAVLLLDDMDVDAKAGRNCLMPASWYRNLLMSNKKELLDLSKYGKAVMQDGELESLFGIRIWRRGVKNLPRYSNAATPVPLSPFSQVGQQNNACANFWHRSAVGSAMGGQFMYATPSAEAQGWHISARIRAGGSPIFPDETGVVSVVETA